jgi:hypothetical protein
MLHFEMPEYPAVKHSSEGDFSEEWRNTEAHTPPPAHSSTEQKLISSLIFALLALKRRVAICIKHSAQLRYHGGNG